MNLLMKYPGQNFKEKSIQFSKNTLKTKMDLTMKIYGSQQQLG